MLGSKQVNIVAITEEILDYMDGYKIVNFNEVIKSDHRAFIFNVVLEDYFGNHTNQYGKANRTILNPH